MMWITWFDNLYASAAFAVILASIYGPFQLVGRLMEMIFGSGVDARLTGAISSLLVPISLFMAQFENGIISIIAMALFGMGHGVTQSHTALLLIYISEQKFMDALKVGFLFQKHWALPLALWWVGYCIIH